MKRLKRVRLLLPAVAALIVALDQISKALVAARLSEGQSWSITPWLASFFRITHVTNTGVAFGLFQNLNYVFVFVHLVVIALIILYYRQLPEDKWRMHLALGIALGGASGNLIDRVRLGRVVDFIDLSFWPLERWPVFNLADASIVTGVALLALLVMWEERQEMLQKEEGDALGDERRMEVAQEAAGE